MASNFVVLDMFSGAGGLSEGFSQNNFDFICHIEMNNHAANTLETRSLYHTLVKNNRQDLYYDYYNGQISRDVFIHECKELNITNNCIFDKEITDENENFLINAIHRRMEKQKKSKIDVIIGGPPCQAYSLIGRGRDQSGMQDDPRNLLYRHYLNFLEAFSPEFFVFENVPGILSARNGEVYSDLVKSFKSLGYDTNPEIPILNASDFGVLQNRKRVVFIGWNAKYDFEYPDFPKEVQRSKVWDLLQDLPSLEPGEGSDAPTLYNKVKPSLYLHETGIRTKNDIKVRHHFARNHNDRDRKIYRKAIEEWNNARRRLPYSDLPDELKTHANQLSFLDRFKVVDGEGLSHAIVAHLSKDGHYFIHPDINQARSITVREAARIQSFPDNFLFEGPRTSQYVQIGNAVPPLMARGIAGQIEKMLRTI